MAEQKNFNRKARNIIWMVNIICPVMSTVSLVFISYTVELLEL